MDQFWPNPRNGGAPRSAVPVGAFRQGDGPPAERGAMNGDDLHFGRRRRRTRSSRSESQGSGAEEEWAGGPAEAGPYGQSPVLHHAMQGEPIWYNRSAYEQAESNYHRRLAGTATTGHYEPLSSSARGARGSSRTLTFRSKRPYGQQQQDGWDQEHASQVSHAARSPGARRRQSSRGRNRSTSETEQGGSRGSRGPPRRRRGYSETESRPRWDNTKMSGVECFASENIWFDKHRYDDAEKRFYEGANGPSTQSHHSARSAQQAAKGRPQKRQHRNSSSHAGGEQELVSRMKSMELENQSLHKVVEDMRATLHKLESRVAVLEKTPRTSAPAPVPCSVAAPIHQVKVVQADDDDDDDIDLFGSDEEEDAEAERLKQERIDAYAAKKSKKPVLIAKSSILLDVKPWDDETDMVKLEECVRSVVADGLLWGASKLLPVGYGIMKLQINCVVEDDKVGTDMLEEEITKFEDYVQSVDVAAFNKI